MIKITVENSKGKQLCLTDDESFATIWIFARR
mgnify:CR=1 FL=1